MLCCLSWRPAATFSTATLSLSTSSPSRACFPPSPRSATTGTLRHTLLPLSHAAHSDASSTSRDISRDTIALLGLLGNYRKSEAVNPYLTQLRSLSSPAAVHGFAETILCYMQDILMYALLRSRGLTDAL